MAENFTTAVLLTLNVCCKAVLSST